MKTMRFGVLCCLLSTVGVLLPVRSSSVCGRLLEDVFKGYSFLNPDVLQMKDDTFVPYILQFGRNNQRYSKLQESQQTANSNEWRDKFCQIATLDEVEYVIYEATFEEIETIKNSLRKQSKRL